MFIFVWTRTFFAKVVGGYIFRKEIEKPEVANTTSASTLAFRTTPTAAWLSYITFNKLLSDGEQTFAFVDADVGF